MKGSRKVEKSKSRKVGLGILVVLAGIGLPAGAGAQDVPPEVQISPTTEAPEVPTGGTTIDLQNIVTTAAKGVTTVQEAPAIVTIVTADDIKQWGYRWLEDVLSDVPGWGRYPAEGETAPIMTVRGQTQSMLLLHDGISLFHAGFNLNSIRQSMPLESIKRVEVVTGPGGVLWGANSFQGIVNLITKDADDVNGIEASAGYGDGRGQASDLRVWAMTGQSLWDGRLKLFIHGSYENYLGQIIEARQVIAHSPAPQPNGAALYGTVQESDQKRSFVYTIDGKISSGPLSLYWLWTDGEMHQATTFPLGIVQQNAQPPMLPFGGNDFNDPLRKGRDNQLSDLDRFAALEYRDRFANGRLGLSVKAYVVDNHLILSPFLFIPPSQLLPGGAGFHVDASAYRAGATLDGDVALPHSNRLLFGGEAFREWETGSTASFYTPDPTDAVRMNVNRLPFACPHSDAGLYTPQCPVTFDFPASRNVAAVFLSDQWRPVPTLTLDAGARIQGAFGQRAYDPLALFSGTLVWNFVPNWHLKANFSQGFRPPVFANTAGYGGGVNLGASPTIKNEFSNAAQGEINARILRNVRKIRELTVRADYSYTRIDDLIVIQNGIYQNAGLRSIQSAEFLGRLYLRGDHQIQLGYTFLQYADNSQGLALFLPNHWFNINASFNLLRDKLDMVSTLWLAGAAEDPNRLPGGTPFHFSANCVPMMPQTPATCGADASASDLTLDRLPAIANWGLGLRWRNALSVENLDLSGFAYNLLDQRYYYHDAFNDLSPQLELQPYPAPGRSFFANARIHY